MALGTTFFSLTTIAHVQLLCGVFPKPPGSLKERVNALRPARECVAQKTRILGPGPH